MSLRFPVTALSGGHGHELWRSSGSWYWWWPRVVGQLSGPGDDVVVVDGHFEWFGQGLACYVVCEPELVIEVRRVEGATGETLYVTEHRYEVADFHSAYFWVDLPGDLTGDGITDLAIRVEEYPRSTGDVRSYLTIESTVDGEVLHSSDEAGLSVFGADDLTGDGREELLLHRWDAKQVWVALQPVDGVELWSAGSLSSWAEPAGDQTGDGAGDILLVEGGNVRSLDGATGAARWTVSLD